MYSWCRKWRLSINKTKSSIMHFRKCGTKQTEYTFKWGMNRLETVNCYKYLGLHLYSDIKFSKTAQVLAESATRAMGSLKAKYTKAKFMHYSTYTKLFNSLVCPITDYCAGAWGLGEFESINNILQSACRNFLGAHRHVARICIYGQAWVGYRTPVEETLK